MDPTKSTLLFTENLSLAKPHFSSILAQYFNTAVYQPDIKYNPKSTILCVDVIRRPEIYTTFRDQGFPIVIDSLWERKSKYQLAYPYDNAGAFIMHNVNWFWYNESLHLKDSKLNEYQPARTYKYSGLMPMRRQRPDRDRLLKEIAPCLNNFIWSYVDRDRRLPNDPDLPEWESQRYFNPDWYDNTCFSLVAETQVEPEIEQPIFITEKTFKPVAFKHPFMVFGNQGTLAHLHSLGFETYENLFDESYDNQPTTERLGIITTNVREFIKEPYDQLTQNKIKHNHDRFFNMTLVKQQVIDEIIFPIIEYANL